MKTALSAISENSAVTESSRAPDISIFSDGTVTFEVSLLDYNDIIDSIGGAAFLFQKFHCLFLFS